MADIPTLMTWIDDQHAATQARLAAWVAQNSGSHNPQGLAAMAEQLYQAFQPLSDTVALHPIGDKDSPKCLLAVKHPQAPHQVLCVGHMDTVFGVDHPFQSLRQTGASWQGPGVIDMKGGLAILHTALQALAQLDEAEHLGWQVLITPDEEIGSIGSRHILKACADKAGLGLIFEPGFSEQGGFVLGRGGSGKFTVEYTGRAAHVGRAFKSGRSALVAMAEFIQKIHALNQVGTCVINVGIASGGESVNSVAAHAVTDLDVRVSQPEHLHWFEQQLHAIADAVAKSHGVTCEITGEFTRPIWVPSAHDQAAYALLAQACHACNQRYETAWSGGCSDANLLSEYALPLIDTLGALGTGLHTEHEQLNVESLTARAQLVFYVLAQIARHGYPWEHTSC